MKWTYTTLKTAIQDYLDTSETTFVNNLPIFIQEAEQRILQNVQIPVFRKNVTGQATAPTETTLLLQPHQETLFIMLFLMILHLY